jgi:hypothetical protein
MPPHSRQYRTPASVVLLALQAVATGLHVVPSLVYPPANVRTTTRIVAEISSLGPVWVLVFGVSSLVMGVTLAIDRGQAHAHLICAAVWVMYATGLWIGSLAVAPHGTVLFPVVATFVVIFHMLLAASYNEDAAGRSRR